MPLTLVALAADRFLGTVSLIPSDVATRPELTPWVAALWVEPGHRRQGIGAALVQEASERAFALGMERLFLLAGAHRRAFYEARGWCAYEEDAPRAGMTILRLDRAAI